MATTFKGTLEFHDIGVGSWFLKQGEQLYLLESSKIPEKMKSGDEISILGQVKEVMSTAMKTNFLLEIEKILED